MKDIKIQIKNIDYIAKIIFDEDCIKIKISNNLLSQDKQQLITALFKFANTWGQKHRKDVVKLQVISFNYDSYILEVLTKFDDYEKGSLIAVTF